MPVISPKHVAYHATLIAWKPKEILWSISSYFNPCKKNEQKERSLIECARVLSINNLRGNIVEEVTIKKIYKIITKYVQTVNGNNE